MGTATDKNTLTSLAQLAENQLTPLEAYERVTRLSNNQIEDHQALLKSLKLDSIPRARLIDGQANDFSRPLLSARILLRLFVTHQDCIARNNQRMHLRQIQSILKAQNNEKIEAVIECYRQNLSIPIMYLEEYLSGDEQPFYNIYPPIDKALKVLAIFQTQTHTPSTHEKQNAQVQFYKKIKAQLLPYCNNAMLSNNKHQQQHLKAVLNNAIETHGRAYFKHRHTVLRSKSVSLCFAVFTLLLGPLIRRAFFARSWLPCQARTQRIHEALEYSNSILNRPLKHPMVETKQQRNRCAIQ